ncbi:NrfD/PsrC family molybdoenzyme membrane anchor subunit [Thermogemmatispora sp.]|uniref:NrfD/PsrC family molybdoenzyme membrane anchor subunit n=1 Tax=Thermogemmatispora sp. TaxID=1968838 RepID=UPI001DFB0B43|nr:NrfD/PsrC family molybdoenzyme membrane anchor subunit [Thermogemmatispora sp.]MBX5449150.1 polysulfide reductase NrfD [Thermogemmatispora sp.]
MQLERHSVSAWLTTGRMLAQRLGRLSDSNGWVEHLALLSTGYRPDPEREQREPTYYDYPALKEPVWRWEIVWYFFLGGLAAGCYFIASLAALFGGPEDRATRRTGYYLALLALLPCPLLLIKDLGRPERFLNMLRMFKVRSPMSMGVWCLVSFSFFSGLTAMIQAARDQWLGHWWGARWLARLPQRLLALPGMALSLFLGGYTGVLLAATSIPLWSRSKMLGAVFISSAISTSSALITLLLRLSAAPAAALHKLERLEWGALLSEMLGLAVFLRGSGRAARVLVGSGPAEHGPRFWRFVVAGGLLLPWLLQTWRLLIHRSPKEGASAEALTSQSERGRFSLSGFLLSLLVLIGGYFLRRTIIEAGHTSSRDARTTLWHARTAR